MLPLKKLEKEQKETVSHLQWTNEYTVAHPHNSVI